MVEMESERASERARERESTHITVLAFLAIPRFPEISHTAPDLLTPVLNDLYEDEVRKDRDKDGDHGDDD